MRIPRIRLHLLSLVLVVGLVSSAAGPRPSRALQFTEVTSAAGIRFKHVNASTGQKYFVETMGAGCAFFDFDSDGYLDIYLVNGNVLPGFQPTGPITGALYRNNRNGSFADVTQQAGAGGEGIYGMGVTAGDYDNDGDEDLYITGYHRSVLYRNNGDGTFTDVSAASCVPNLGRWATSAAFLDYDNDGFLDLYVANYVDFSLANNVACGNPDKGIRSYCYPGQFNGVDDVLYHNEGNGTFRDATIKSGISNSMGKGLGVVAADFNEDGWIDIYVANDMVANFLYQNMGDGTFMDVAPFAGAAYSAEGKPQAGMGVDAGDYNMDGRPDILVTNFSREVAALYRNEGNLSFTEVSFQTGVGEPTFMPVGWGARFFDYDNDADQDLFIVNGHSQDDIALYTDVVTYLQPKLLLENDGGHFIDVSRARGEALSVPTAGRGAAFGDIDNDGDIDVLLTNCNGSPLLLRNDGGNRKNWLKLKLVGNRSNRSAIGTSVKLEAAGRVQVDQVKGGGSYLSAHDLRLHFGLNGSDHAESIEIRWPSGRIQHLENIPSNQILIVREEAD